MKNKCIAASSLLFYPQKFQKRHYELTKLPSFHFHTVICFRHFVNKIFAQAKLIIIIIIIIINYFICSYFDYFDICLQNYFYIFSDCLLFFYIITSNFHRILQIFESVFLNHILPICRKLFEKVKTMKKGVKLVNAVKNEINYEVIKTVEVRASQFWRSLKFEKQKKWYLKKCCRASMEKCFLHSASTLFKENHGFTLFLIGISFEMT